MGNNCFVSRKKYISEKLENAIRNNEIDREILPFLEKINRYEAFYTTSSCAGRILVADIPEDNNKLKTRFILCLHSDYTWNNILDALNSRFEHWLWFFVQPPIFHIVAYNIETAGFLVKAGLHSGFKHTSIISIQPTITVEIKDTVNISMPIGKYGKIEIDTNFLKEIFYMGDKKLKKARKKIKKLEDFIEKYYPTKV